MKLYIDNSQVDQGKMVNTFFTECGTNFRNMAKSLDRQRRFKQAVEVKEILLTIERKKSSPENAKIGFKNHPIVLMWLNYEECLKHYFNAFFDQLQEDGFVMKKLQKYENLQPMEKTNIPWFLYFEPLVYSHLARLVQKDPVYYSHFKDKIPEKYFQIGYIWIREKFSMDYYLQNTHSPEKIADPLEKRYTDGNYCKTQIASGKKKGQICGKLLKSSHISACGIHKKKHQKNKKNNFALL